MRVESIVDVFSFPVGAECEKYTYKFKDQQPWKKYQIVSNERSAFITVSCRITITGCYPMCVSCTVFIQD